MVIGLALSKVWKFLSPEVGTLLSSLLRGTDLSLVLFDISSPKIFSFKLSYSISHLILEVIDVPQSKSFLCKPSSIPSNKKYIEICDLW